MVQYVRAIRYNVCTVCMLYTVQAITEREEVATMYQKVTREEES